MQKEKQPSLDLIRAVSIIAIVLEHFSYSFIQFGIPGDFVYFLKFANGDWGGTFVSVFFMLSGAALIYNHPVLTREGEKGFKAKLKGILRFYLKRMVTLFPLFYFCWFIFYVLTSKAIGLWNWGGNWSNLLYTFFGVDGYFLHRGFNYFCVGEWFLGAIIILYLLFPLLRFCFMKLRAVSTVLITALFLLNIFRYNFISSPGDNLFIRLIKWYDTVIEVPDSRNILTCTMFFWTGMLLITYRNVLVKLWTALVSLIFMVIMVTIELPLQNEIISDWLCACAVYLILAYIAPFVMRFVAVQRIVGFIGKYSYGIFLIHHQILYLIMPRLTEVNFTYTLSLLLFVGVMALVTLISFVLTNLVNIVMHPVRSYNKLTNFLGVMKGF